MRTDQVLRNVVRGALILALIALSLAFMIPPSASHAQSSIVINEIRTDQPGADNDEYFELFGPASASLDGLTYLVIGDVSANSGVIEEVTNLTGYSIPAGGYFVAAESTFSLGTADLTTSLNFENDDNVTHMLVSGFTGSDGDDLDTNDDGTLDSTPWSSVEHCVALYGPESSDLVYCSTVVGPDGATDVPGHVYRCSVGWQIGQFDPVGGDDTPGAINGDCVTAVRVSSLAASPGGSPAMAMPIALGVAALLTAGGSYAAMWLRRREQS